MLCKSQVTELKEWACSFGFAAPESLRQEDQELKGSLGDHQLQPVLTRVETLSPKPKKNKKERKEIKPLEMAKK